MGTFQSCVINVQIKRDGRYRTIILLQSMSVN